MVPRSTGGEIEELLPTLRTWLRRVFTVLGGHAFAAGALTISVAVTDVREGDQLALVALAGNWLRRNGRHR